MSIGGVTDLYGSIKSNNYPAFYNHVYRADSLKYHGELEDAFKAYNLGFSEVDFIPSSYCLKAFLLAIDLGELQKAKMFGRLYVINSGKAKRIKTKNKTFRKSNAYQELTDSLSHYLEIHSQRINQDYVKLIDSLFYVDQVIVRRKKLVKGFSYRIDKTKHPENTDNLDQELWLTLSAWIDSIGFPSEQLVGIEAYQKANVILWHNLREKQNAAYHPRILDFIKSGEYYPNDMMVWFEQYHQWNFGTTFFTTWGGNLTENEIIRINRNRANYHMQSLNAYEILKGGKYMKLKW